MRSSSFKTRIHFATIVLIIFVEKVQEIGYIILFNVELRPI